MLQQLREDRRQNEAFARRFLRQRGPPVQPAFHRLDEALGGQAHEIDAVRLGEDGRLQSVLAQTGFLLQVLGEPRAQRIHLITQVGVADVENGQFHGRRNHDEVVVNVVAELDLIGRAHQIDQNLKTPAPDAGVDVAQVRVHLLHGENDRLVELRDGAVIIGLGLLPEHPQLGFLIERGQHRRKLVQRVRVGRLRQIRLGGGEIGRALAPQRERNVLAQFRGGILGFVIPHEPPQRREALQILLGQILAHSSRAADYWWTNRPVHRSPPR